MKLKHITIFSLVVVLFTSFVLTPVHRAEAFLDFETNPAVLLPLADIAVNTTDSAIADDISAATLVELALSFGSPIESTISDEAGNVLGICDVTDIADSGGGFFESLSSNLAAISGGTGESVNLARQVKTLEAKQTCLKTSLATASAVPAPTYRMQYEKAQKVEEIKAEITGVKERLAKLQIQQTASTKEVLRAVATKIVLNLQQSFTTSFVNDLKGQFQIKRLYDYTDALATQIYQTDYLLKNYPDDKSTQMVLRVLLQNDRLGNAANKSQVFPIVRAQAQKMLSEDPASVSLSDTAFYDKMYKARRDPESLALLLQTDYNEKKEQVKAAAFDAAQKEVAQGDGTMAIRNCGDAVNQQSQIDSKVSKLSSEYDINQEVYERLQAQAKSNPGSVDASEIKKAQDAALQAEGALTQLPENSDMLVSVCEGIEDPGKFVSNFINDYLQSHIQESFDIKSDNLPWWGDYLAKVGNNLASKVLGGGKGTGKVFSEQGLNVLKSAGQAVGQTSGLDYTNPFK